MTDAVNDNPAKSRYELHAEGGTAIAAYARDGDVLAFNHTLVPEPLRGRGLAGRLVEGALADVRRRGLKFRAECAFVVDYVAQHPDVQDLLAD